VREVVQQLEGGLIGPVDVLEDEQHWIFCDQSGERSVNELERFGSSVRVAARTTFELGEQRLEKLAQRAEHFCDLRLFTA
jgi:hypothetical protein